MTIRISRNNKGEPVYHLSGVIGTDVKLEELKNSFKDDTNDYLNLYIDSVGGYVDEGDQIIQSLATSGKKINVYIGSLAGSIAAKIATAFGRFYMDSSSTLMIHGCSCSVWDNLTAKKLEELTQAVTAINSNLINHFQRAIGYNPDGMPLVANYVSDGIDHFLGYEQLKKLGFDVVQVDNYELFTQHINKVHTVAKISTSNNLDYFIRNMKIEEKTENTKQKDEQLNALNSLIKLQQQEFEERQEEKKLKAEAEEIRKGKLENLKRIETLPAVIEMIDLAISEGTKVSECTAKIQAFKNSLKTKATPEIQAQAAAGFYPNMLSPEEFENVFLAQIDKYRGQPVSEHLTDKERSFLKYDFINVVKAAANYKLHEKGNQLLDRITTRDELYQCVVRSDLKEVVQRVTRYTDTKLPQATNLLKMCDIINFTDYEYLEFQTDASSYYDLELKELSEEGTPVMYKPKFKSHFMGLKSFGLGMSFSYETRVSQFFDKLFRQTAKLQQAARLKLDDLVLKCLGKNKDNFTSVDGAKSLDLNLLQQVDQKFSELKDEQGNPVQVTPHYLVCSRSLLPAINQLLGSDSAAGQDNSGVINPFKNYIDSNKVIFIPHLKEKTGTDHENDLFFIPQDVVKLGLLSKSGTRTVQAEDPIAESLKIAVKVAANAEIFDPKFIVRVKGTNLTNELIKAKK